MPNRTVAVFIADKMIVQGRERDAAAVLRDAGPGVMPLVFDCATGAQIDLDASALPTDGAAAPAPVRGRPKLGVVAREVTLLPRHWDWLNAQPGGASVALRKLVEDARKTRAFEDVSRRAQEAANRFLTAMAGDLPGYEEATRALFAGDRARFDAITAAWPEDVGRFARALAGGVHLEPVAETV